MKVRVTPLLIAALASVGVAVRESAYSVVRAAPERQDAQQSGTQAGASRSVWDGVYSDEQAKRGQSAYLDECARCHSDTLLGAGDAGPPLVGEVFISKWNGQSVGDLFELVRTTMPQDSAGRLTRQQTSDILACVLQGNGFPPGQRALDTDLAALNMIKIQAKAPRQDQ